MVSLEGTNPLCFGFLSLALPGQESLDSPSGLPLSTDLVSQDKVGDQTERHKENAQHNEVQVELSILNIQLLQNGF